MFDSSRSSRCVASAPQVLREVSPACGHQTLSAEVGEEHPDTVALGELVGVGQGLGHLM